VQLHNPRLVTFATCITGFFIGLLSWFGVADSRRELLVEISCASRCPKGGGTVSVTGRDTQLVPPSRTRPMPFFGVTYADGSVEEMEADELRDAGTTPF
jgi:hypothetical protein